MYIRLNMFSSRLFLRRNRYFSSIRNNHYKNKFTNEHLSSKRSIKSNSKILWYILTVWVGMVGVTYASVPLYQVFCQVTGYGGTTQVASKRSKLYIYDNDNENENEKNNNDEKKELAKNRIIKVNFVSFVDKKLPWEFTPCQDSLELRVGESALAFYKAKNLSDKALIGVATYNITPFQGGLYFNKIQCFCFDEQRLQPNEEVDMPVFFFLDPDLLDDERMDNITSLTLGYTFFNSQLNEDEDYNEEYDENDLIPMNK